MKVLITGAGGLLGPYVEKAFERHNVVAHTGVDCGAGDLRKLRTAERWLDYRGGEDVVIHLVAMTNLEECEHDPLKALEVNRDTTYNIATQMNPKAKLVYISTDMIYRGEGPHTEIEGSPLNVYGRTKLAGEKVAAINPRALILRTNFFGKSKTLGRRSFSDMVIDDLTVGRRLTLWNDVWWTPLHMETVSSMLLEAVERDLVGRYNLGSREGMTKAETGIAITKHYGLGDVDLILDRMPENKWVKRPKDMRMDVSKIGKALGREMPTLKEEIKKL